MFLHCNHDRIAIGGGVVGGAGHAIEIDRDLHHGTTHSSTTFANEPLVRLTPASFFERCSRVQLSGIALLTAHIYRMLIGACNLAWCPIRLFRPQRQSSSASGSSSGASRRTWTCDTPYRG